MRTGAGRRDGGPASGPGRARGVSVGDAAAPWNRFVMFDVDLSFGRPNRDNRCVGVGALGERVRAGDRDAFAELYGEFADRLFGFCLVLLRDRDEAADAAQDAFVLAVQRASQLRDPERLHAWLFAIARHVCFRRLEQRRRVTPGELPADVLVLDDDPGEGLAASEAVALVWDAASGLNDRDRAVLYLSTREGLEGAELAAALGLQHANPYSLLHRARSQLERAVTVLLVARANRQKCVSLGSMLDGWDGTLTPLMRKRLGRHVEECASCQAAKVHTARWAAFAAAPLVKPGRADAMSADGLLRIAAHRLAPAEAWLPDGFPPLEVEAARRRRRWLLVAAALVVLLVALLGVETMSGASKSTARPRPAAHRVVKRRRATVVHNRPVRSARPAPQPGPALAAPTTTVATAIAPPVGPLTTVRVQSVTATTPRPTPPVAPRPTTPPTTSPRHTTTTRPPSTTTTVSTTSTTISF